MVKIVLRGEEGMSTNDGVHNDAKPNDTVNNTCRRKKTTTSKLSKRNKTCTFLLDKLWFLMKCLLLV